MKGKKKISLAKIGEHGLWVLEKIAYGGYVASEHVVVSLHDAFIYRGYSPSRSRGYSKQTLQCMEDQNLIYKDGIHYKLTTRGHWEAARRRLLDKPKDHVPNKWDEKWRMVIFDVPEIERKHRNVLRYAIRSYGLKQLQQSVWVYPYDCSEFVTAIKNDLDFKAEVLFVLVDQIENQKFLEEEFDLRN